jgi:hypothetical protein
VHHKSSQVGRGRGAAPIDGGERSRMSNNTCFHAEEMVRGAHGGGGRPTDGGSYVCSVRQPEEGEGFLGLDWAQRPSGPGPLPLK